MDLSKFNLNQKIDVIDESNVLELITPYEYSFDEQGNQIKKPLADLSAKPKTYKVPTKTKLDDVIIETNLSKFWIQRLDLIEDDFSSSSSSADKEEFVGEPKKYEDGFRLHCKTIYVVYKGICIDKQILAEYFMKKINSSSSKVIIVHDTGKKETHCLFWSLNSFDIKSQKYFDYPTVEEKPSIYTLTKTEKRKVMHKLKNLDISADSNMLTEISTTNEISLISISNKSFSSVSNSLSSSSLKQNEILTHSTETSEVSDCESTSTSSNSNIFTVPKIYHSNYKWQIDLLKELKGEADEHIMWYCPCKHYGASSFKFDMVAYNKFSEIGKHLIRTNQMINYMLLNGFQGRDDLFGHIIRMYDTNQWNGDGIILYLEYADIPEKKFETIFKELTGSLIKIKNCILNTTKYKLKSLTLKKIPHIIVFTDFARGGFPENSQNFWTFRQMMKYDTIRERDFYTHIGIASLNSQK